jgi:RND superfamily putative drug exporter
LLERIAGLAARRPRLLLAGTAVFFALAGAFGGPMFGLLTSSGRDFEDPGSESVAARATLERATGTNPDVAAVVLIRTPEGARSDAGRAKVERVSRILAEDEDVARVSTAFTTGSESLVARDGSSTYAVVNLKPLSVTEEKEAVERLTDRLEGTSDVLLGGAVVANSQVDEQVEKDLAGAERFAIPILFALTLLFFRGLIAALLPFAVGAVAILGTFFAMRIIHESITTLSVFALNLVTGVGLGLALDYSLFIVSRYREELARVGPGAEALRRTMVTAGRTVAFSALTVAAALSSLLVFPQRFLYSMGTGGVLIALFSAASALIFLPALLAVLGTRVNALSPARWRQASERAARMEQSGFWYRVSQAVMRRAGIIAVASATALVVVGLPFFGIKFIGVDPAILPESASARQVHDTLRSDYSENRSSPIYVAVKAPRAAASELTSYASELEVLPSTAAVIPPRLVGADTWRLEVVPEGRTVDESTRRLVDAIRAKTGPGPVEVGGETASYQDQQASFSGRLPLGLLIVIVTTLVILFLMTGSLILPIKTLIMSAVTLIATLGLLVFIFQEGRLEGLLGYTTQGALNATQPILIGAIVFALSTDYAIFLLARIKEGRDRGLGDTEAVAAGIERTGRIVTAAAVLLAIAVGAFVTSEVLFMKLLGLGVAFAVLLDATVVRGLLVPSLMKLLGRWNWWAPAPLRRLHNRFGVSEAG